MGPLAFGLLALLGPVVTIIDQVVGDTGRAKVLRIVKSLEDQINRTTTLKNQLIDAFNRKDYDLANSLLYSSPFSGTYQILQKERDRIQREAKDKYDRIQNVEDKIAKSKAEYDQHTTAAGTVGGTLAHLEDAKSDFTNDINDLVKGGVTTISNQPESEFRGVVINNPKK